MMKLLSNAWTMARTTGRVFFPAWDTPARYGDKGNAGAAEDLTSVAGDCCVIAATPQHRNTATPQHRNTATPQHRNTATPQHRNTATPQHRNTATPVPAIAV